MKKLCKVNESISFFLEFMSKVYFLMSIDISKIQLEFSSNFPSTLIVQKTYPLLLHLPTPSSSFISTLPHSHPSAYSWPLLLHWNPHILFSYLFFLFHYILPPSNHCHMHFQTSISSSWRFRKACFEVPKAAEKVQCLIFNCRLLLLFHSSG